MQQKQESVYSAERDYRAESPHLAHHALYDRLVGILRQTLRDLKAAGLPLSVLEIGAGHGGFTEPALAAGCQVTAVEMSRPSLARLAEKFGANANFTGVFDPDGTLSEVGSGFSLTLCVLILHHIPDYLAALTQASSRLVPGGALLKSAGPDLVSAPEQGEPRPLQSWILRLAAATRQLETRRWLRGASHTRNPGREQPVRHGRVPRCAQRRG